MNAPERIWAWEFMPKMQNEDVKGGWVDVPDRRETEYVRADLFAAEKARADKAETLLAEAVEALRDYADTFCEHSPYDEVCGHLSRFDCSGCLARATLAKIKENGNG